MPLLKKMASIDVVEAAKIRVKNIFSNGLRVYLGFSGGKDSLAIAHLILDLIHHKEIDPKLLIVQFVDEEAIYDCVERTVLEWGQKFLLAGAAFEWLCLPVKHFNCFNALENDESFICWDTQKEDVWIRRPPSFAIRSHPRLKPGIDTYQDFLHRICCNCITIVGVRAYESVQRLMYMATMGESHNDMTNDHRVYPLYDWRDNDVWLYLLNNHIDYPDAYKFMWQVGTAKNRLRISQFFSIDTAGSLVRMNEFYPDLMKRISNREPNAYLAALYWDTSMFRRSTEKRKKLEKEQIKNDATDYRKLLGVLVSDIERNFKTEHQRTVAQAYRNAFIKFSMMLDNDMCKKMYDSLLAGDPKYRTLRALKMKIDILYTNSKLNKPEAIKS